MLPADTLLNTSMLPLPLPLPLPIQAEHQGVLIRRVEPTAPEGAALKQWDILMAFDGEHCWHGFSAWC
jgi:hypothetical protein